MCLCNRTEACNADYSLHTHTVEFEQNVIIFLFFLVKVVSLVRTAHESAGSLELNSVTLFVVE